MTPKNKAFGGLVRQLRLRTSHPVSKRELRQGELAEAIGNALGRPDSYGAPTISNWENGNHLPANRKVTLALIRILIQYGGLTQAEEANSLLQAADQSVLTTTEREALLGVIATPTVDDPSPDDDEPRVKVEASDDRGIPWLFLAGLGGIAFLLACLVMGGIAAFLTLPLDGGTPALPIVIQAATTTPPPTVTAPASATATLPPATPTPQGWTEILTVSVGAITTAIVPAGAWVEVVASGTIVAGASIGTVDPAGRTDFPQGPFTLPISTGYNIDKSIPHGALLCRLEREIEWRACGFYLEFEAPSEGRLELRLNDNTTGDNSGAYNVRVTVRE